MNPVPFFEGWRFQRDTPAYGTPYLELPNGSVQISFGRGAFGIEIFEPPTSSALMAALLVHDLRNPSAAAQPARA